MEFVELRDFRQSVNALHRRGGRYQKAAKDVHALVGRISMEQDPLSGLRFTKHGESRIRNCTKYDLNDFCRLITVQTSGYCILLYCGDHGQCEQWLEANRGFVPVVDKERRVTATYQTSERGATDEVIRKGAHGAGRLFERLPEALFELLVDTLPRKTIRSLEDLDSAIQEDELWLLLADMTDGPRRLAIRDAFALLRDDKVREAIARINLYFGDLTVLEVVPRAELPEIIDSDVLRRIPRNDPRYAEATRRFMETARYKDWMMFMHPEQEEIALADFDGPAKLAGVSGSGKTCVVVQRAVRLAAKYQHGTILVLTLNRALAKLIDDLVSACSPDEARQRIVVRPFFEECRRLMLKFDPRGKRLYDEVTWKTNEHVDEVWQEYYRCELNNHDARVFQEVHDSLLSRKWNPERYLREEVDWLRSALRPAERVEYLEIVRAGRTVNLPRQYRERVLEGATGWEEKMSAVGVIDTLGLAQCLADRIEGITADYRCVLVDEVQDFGNVELAIVRALVPRGENDLFLCGDAAQAVTSKYQSMKAVGLSIPQSRSRKLSQNYRNSKDVLKAAYDTFFANLTDEMLDKEDLQILDPDTSAVTGATPLILRGLDLETELRSAIAACREKTGEKENAKTCIAICGFSLYELTKFGESVHLPVLDGSVGIDDGTLFLSDLEQTKGFEFDLVVIVNCSEGVVPDAFAPEEEQYRDLSRLYVAMTRATTDLIISFSGRPSPFVMKAKESFYEDEWSGYVNVNAVDKVAIPKRLESFRDGVPSKEWKHMSAEEFLYSDLALGVSTDLSAKMRALIDGKGLRKNRQLVKWRNLGSAAESFQNVAQARVLWGPESGRQFLALVNRLSGERVSN